MYCLGLGLLENSYHHLPPGPTFLWTLACYNVSLNCASAFIAPLTFAPGSSHHWYVAPTEGIMALRLKKAAFHLCNP